MEDLIRRQDAIDALKRIGLGLAESQIALLPSAKPANKLFAEIKIDGEELQECMDRAIKEISAQIQRSERMKTGTALAIFENIEVAKESVEEKGLAIRIVLDMETHNGVRKEDMLKVINWLWHLCFEEVK